MQKQTKKSIFPLILSILLMLFLFNFLTSESKGPNYKYYEIINLFKTGEVKDYVIDFGSGALKIRIDRTPEEIEEYDKKFGNLEEQLNKNKEKVDLNLTAQLQEKEKQKRKEEILNKRNLKEIIYKLPSISVFLEDIKPFVTSYNEQHPDAPIKVDYIPPVETPWWVNLLPTLLIFASMGFLFFFMMKQGDGGGKAMSFGKIKARQVIDENNKVTFQDVAGADEEKEELEELVDFLKDASKFDALGAKIPKGVLLVGPPGTGKTLLAKAVAGEAGVPFFSISGSDFVEMFVGVGAKRVRDLFEQAKTSAPSIIFIDEIDAVGRQRGAGLGGGNDEREQTLNQLLVEMDGFGANQGVIIIAATNRRDVLDPALLRPGRFDRQIYVNRPDIKGREDILKVHTQNKPLAPDVSLRTVAKGTVGFTGADLANVVNEASLLAAKEEKKSVLQRHFENAIIKVIAGPEKKTRVITENDKKLTAYHEAGHAIATYFCDKVDKVHEISIIPRGMAGGYTLSLPEKDESYRLKMQMEQELIVLLGGRGAEKLILGDISTGASNDIQRVTALAKSMVKQYGFSDVVGPIVYGTDSSEVFLGRDYGSSKDYSEATSLAIDNEIKEIVFKSYSKCQEILKENIEKLHLIAEVLMAFEKIDGTTFQKLMTDQVTLEELKIAEEEQVKKEKKRELQKQQAVSSTSLAETSQDTENLSEKSVKEPVDEDDNSKDLVAENTLKQKNTSSSQEESSVSPKEEKDNTDSI